MKTLNDLSNEGVRFIVIKKDDTEYWREDIVKKAKRIWTVCLIDLTKPTHLCELAVSYPYEEISNFFESADEFSEDEITDLEHGNLDSGYFTGNSTFKIEKAYNDEDDDFESVMEYERCNPTIC